MKTGERVICLPMLERIARGCSVRKAEVWVIDMFYPQYSLYVRMPWLACVESMLELCFAPYLGIRS